MTRAIPSREIEAINLPRNFQFLSKFVAENFTQHQPLLFLRLPFKESGERFSVRVMMEMGELSLRTAQNRKSKEGEGKFTVEGSFIDVFLRRFEGLVQRLRTVVVTCSKRKDRLSEPSLNSLCLHDFSMTDLCRERKYVD